MTNKELENVLQWAAQAPHEVDPAVVRQVFDRVLPDLRPIRPMSDRLTGIGLMMIFLAVGVLGAVGLGSGGMHIRNGAAAIVFYWALSWMARLAAGAAVAEMIPGSRRGVDMRWILGGGTAAFVANYAVLGHYNGLDRFLPEGLHCLGLGLIVGAAAAFLVWLVLRRGLILDPPAAGMAAGTLAGLTGVGMLELHCPIVSAVHLMVWHVAVIPVGGLAGYLIGRWAAGVRAS